MDILKKINWKQPKYMIPLIIYFPLLFVGYFVIDLFHTEKADIPDKSLATTEYLNPELPTNTRAINSNAMKSDRQIHGITAM